MLVIFTGTVTGVPAASFVAALSGSPAALTFTALKRMLPVYGWEISFPTTGSAKSTTSVHVPGAGSSVFAVSEVRAVPLSEFCPYPSVSPSGLIRYAPTGSVGVVGQIDTFALMSRHSGRHVELVVLLPGPHRWRARCRRSARRENEPAPWLPTWTRLRSVTGIEVDPPKPKSDLSTIEPAASPGDDGVVALTVTVRLWPGPSNTRLGDTEPNCTNCSVATRQGTVPFVPPSAATSPKITPVHVPGGRGADVDVRRNCRRPCGSECAANRPRGSIRISRTREFRPVLHTDAGSTQYD